jgi:hypothetical protein
MIDIQLRIIQPWFKSLNLQLRINGLHVNITTGTTLDGPGRNVLLNFFKDNNLLNNKHIPDTYKFNSRENRLKLLAGLIDSDGYLSNNVYEFTLKSEILVNDIIFLVRSLCFFTYKKEIQKTCTNGPNGSVTGNYLRFHICGEGLEEILVLLERKRAHERRSKKMHV